MSNIDRKNEGKLEQVGGKIKGAIGAAVGNERMRAEGEAQELRGEAREEGAKAAERTATAASCSAVGRSVTAVSAISTVCWRPTTTLIPNGAAPSSSSITVRTSRSDWLNGRVVPVIIASPSPSASIVAAKMLRSWLTIRSTWRRSMPWRWRRS